jgi:hypothetical protein
MLKFSKKKKRKRNSLWRKSKKYDGIFDNLSVVEMESSKINK